MSAPSRSYIVDVIAGDGIGQEVVPAAVQCADVLAAWHGFELNWRHREWGSNYYRAAGVMMPDTALDELATGDAILLGAVGDPSIPDDLTLWGLLIPIRRRFQQYVNLRPIRTLPGVPNSLDREFDIVIVRENVEGEYSEIGGRFNRGQPDEFAVQESIFTRVGVARVAHYAAKLATSRGGVLTSATKSNGIIHTMPFWDEIVNEVVAEYPELRVDSVLIDSLAARFVLQPERIDVVVASNLFGDILSDLAAAVAGSIGIAPSANLNPDGDFPSLFEPVHGSAPDIFGQGIANPVATMWATSMMLEHLGETSAAKEYFRAFADVLESGIRTRDLGGTASTSAFTEAVLELLERKSGRRRRRDVDFLPAWLSK